MGQSEPPPILTPEEATEQLASLESRLVALQAELDQSNRLATIGMMTAGIAHEINNLLTPVVAYAQLAESRPDDDEIVEKCLSRTRIAGEAAAHILKAVLEFAKPDDPSTSPAADVGKCLDDALACLGSQLEKGRVHLERSIPAGITACIPPKALQQVFLNLVSNSQRALEDHRGGTISINASSSDQRTTIVVEDDGPGLPPHLASTLFDPFVTGSRGGHGLGLKLVRDAIRAAGGSITASAGSPGARFSIELLRPPTTLHKAS